MWIAITALALGLVGYVVRAGIRRNGRLKTLAQSRPDDRCETFSASLQNQEVPEDVLRIVYVKLQDGLASECPSFPLRLNDQLETFGVVVEDLYDLVEEIVEAIGGTMPTTAGSTRETRILTVGELVEFILACRTTPPAVR